MIFLKKKGITTKEKKKKKKKKKKKRTITTNVFGYWGHNEKITKHMLFKRIQGFKSLSRRSVIVS